MNHTLLLLHKKMVKSLSQIAFIVRGLSCDAIIVRSLPSI